MSMDSPLFLTRSQVERMHAVGLRRYGGSAGVREPGLVDSALASAQNTFFYGHGDVFDIGAAYAFHLTEAQAFVDGNKRVAAAAALVFLEVNGVSTLPDDDTLYAAMIQIAEKQLTKSGLAGLLRKHAQSKD
jgi:death-on-curing protein